MSLCKTLLAPHAERAFTLLRIVSGFLLSLHGLAKFGVLGKHIPPVGSQLWVGAWIELVAGLLVMVGLWTRPAAFVTSGTMAVAYVQFHWKLQLDKAFLPTQNGGELALIYSLVFLYIACHGAGDVSLDQWRARRRGKAP
jgi:putative oxidoreductase